MTPKKMAAKGRVARGQAPFPAPQPFAAIFLGVGRAAAGFFPLLLPSCPPALTASGCFWGCRSLSGCIIPARWARFRARSPQSGLLRLLRQPHALFGLGGVFPAALFVILLGLKSGYRALSGCIIHARWARFRARSPQSGLLRLLRQPHALFGLGGVFPAALFRLSHS